MVAQETKNDAESILNAALGLAPLIRDCREEIERERRLPLRLVAAMKQAGVFRMPMPRDWGGPELDPLSQIRVIEALAAVDASVGWCVMIGCDGGYLTAFLDQTVAREMYHDLDAVTAPTLSITGRATATDAGYRVSGRWPFASGCQHSTWVVAGCAVYDGDQPRQLPDGTPVTRQCFLPTADVEILDAWYTTGLRGSGSHDFTTSGCFVPSERSYSYQQLEFHRDGPLYRFPLNILYKVAAPALGAARGAIDALVADGERPSRRMTVAGMATPQIALRDEAYVQDALGRAEALLGAARAFTFDIIGELYAAVAAGHELTPRLFSHVLLLDAQVYRMCSDTVELVYKARGGSAVYASGQLDRYFRDMLTMNQHVINSERFYAMAGRALFGFPPEGLFL